MMAEIALHGAKESIDSRGYISIQDPTLGAGVMLIAAAHVLSNSLKDGRNWQNHSLFVGQEISTVAAQMAYIQLSLLGCAGYIKIGNSLTSPMNLTIVWRIIGSLQCTSAVSGRHGGLLTHPEYS